MTAPVSDPASDSPFLAPVRGTSWRAQATYDRGPAKQATFERAVATPWAEDALLNPRTRQREFKTDLVLEGGGVEGIGLPGDIGVVAETAYQSPGRTGCTAMERALHVTVLRPDDEHGAAANHQGPRVFRPERGQSPGVSLA